jgi:hypothetical protein
MASLFYYPLREQVTSRSAKPKRQPARSADVSDHGGADGRAGPLVDQDQAAGHPVASVRIAEQRLRQPQRDPVDAALARYRMITMDPSPVPALRSSSESRWPQSWPVAGCSHHAPLPGPAVRSRPAVPRRARHREACRTTCPGYSTPAPASSWEPYDTSPAAIADGHSDAYITRFARAVRALNVPVVISFGHEMNGNWYPWETTQSTPAEFVAAWRHIHDLFIQAGASNVIWVWNPNIINPMPQGPAQALLAWQLLR